MKNKIIKSIAKLLTGNAHNIPLLFISLDMDKYHTKIEGSAKCNFHPAFRDDAKLKQMAFEIIDHIRENYDMDKIL